MSTGRVNYWPRLPELFRSTGVIDDFTLIDVGASGGIEGHWQPFGRCLRAIGFDPLVNEINRLNSVNNNHNIKYVSAFVTCDDNVKINSDIKNDITKSKDNQTFSRSSSVLATTILDMDYTKEVFNSGEALKFSEQYITLDDYFKDYGYESIDFIKIDTDGFDFEVLMGADKLLSSGGVLGLSVEVQFHGAVDDKSNVFTNIDRYLRSRGFSLFDLDVYRYSRGALPAQFLYNIPAQTVTGQVMWGEAVYFRDLANKYYNKMWDFNISESKLAKLACLYEIFGLSDCAAELILESSEIKVFSNLEELLNCITPNIYEERTNYKKYMLHFRDHMYEFYPEPNLVKKDIINKLPMSGCVAPWYELNISSGDNEVSCCCYYSGSKDICTNEPHDIDLYWNSEKLQKVRSVNISKDDTSKTGCTHCFYYESLNAYKLTDSNKSLYAPEFLSDITAKSALQRYNWRLAVDDYKNKRTVMRATPLRFYLNFGFACNFFCGNCIQLPRRNRHSRQLSADVVWQWRDYFMRALDISIIGGEPLLMTESLKFINKVVDDKELEDVRLTIMTNGSLIHKHIDLLKRKRKLTLMVSLYSIYEGFEKLHTGGSWSQVESNIKLCQEISKDKDRDWFVGVVSGLMKTSIKFLEDFARWCVENKIAPRFFEVIVVRGIEKYIITESILQFPYLLIEVADWEMHFKRAADIFMQHEMLDQSNQLEHYLKILTDKVSIEQYKIKIIEKACLDNNWIDIFHDSARNAISNYIFVDQDRVDAVVLRNDNSIIICPTSLHDHVATDFIRVNNSKGSGYNCIEIELIWSEAYLSERPILYIQDGCLCNIRIINTEQSDININIKYRTIYYFAINSEISSFRLLFNSPNIDTPVEIPISIHIRLSC